MCIFDCRVIFRSQTISTWFRIDMAKTSISHIWWKHLRFCIQCPSSSGSICIPNLVFATSAPRSPSGFDYSSWLKLIYYRLHLPVPKWPKELRWWSKFNLSTILDGLSHYLHRILQRFKRSMVETHKGCRSSSRLTTRFDFSSIDAGREHGLSVAALIHTRSHL
jgi:hypothetical protein